MSKHLKVWKMITLALLVAMLTGCCVGNQKVSRTPLPERLKASTVAFVMPDEDGDITTYCTGIFISENEILTVKHCVVASILTRMPPQIRRFAQSSNLMDMIELVGANMPYSMDIHMGEIGENPDKVYMAEVAAVDEKHDLALLKTTGPHPLHLNAILSNKNPMPGDPVVMMGHPSRLTYSLMLGDVAAIRNTLPVANLDIAGPFLQIISNISAGWSGSGIFNQDGYLVGMVSFTVAIPGNGFGIHRDSIKAFLKEAHKVKPTDK